MITINLQTVAAVGVGAVGVAGLSVAAVLASEFVLLGLPLVMGPGAVMTTHRLLLAHHQHHHYYHNIKASISMISIIANIISDLCRFLNTGSKANPPCSCATICGPCGLKITVGFELFQIKTRSEDAVQHLDHVQM